MIFLGFLVGLVMHTISRHVKDTYYQEETKLALGLSYLFVGIVMAYGIVKRNLDSIMFAVGAFIGVWAQPRVLRELNKAMYG